MNAQEQTNLETDPRFPSGPWTGFFLQPGIPGRHMMEIGLTFCNGKMTAEGRDWVGKFIMKGSYDVQDGKCHWTKRYLGAHDVYYQGYNEGKGIWGTWEFPHLIAWPSSRGGFHIWPEGMANPTNAELAEEADIPDVVEGTLQTSEPLATPL